MRRVRCAAIVPLLVCFGLFVSAPGASAQLKPLVERARREFAIGYTAHMMGDLKAAKAYYRASISSQPTAEAYTFLGWAYSHTSLIDRAGLECKRAILVDATFGNPYNDIGVYLIERRRHEQAILYLKAALRAKRYCCFQYAHFNLGRVYLMQGKIDAAMRQFRSAVKIAPDYLPAVEALEAVRRHLKGS
jgi:Tfp pilus assembly protein PilF